MPKLSKSLGWRQRAEFKEALAETIELQDQSVVRVSCHEIGHGGTAWFDEDNIDEVGKVCNRPTPDADGYTEYNLAGRYTRKQLKAKLTALVGGKAGEILFTGTSIGHLGDDVHKFDRLAEKLAMGSYEWMALGDMPAEEKAERLAAMKQQLIDEAEQKATQILTRNKKKIEKAIIDLMFKRILYNRRLRQLLGRPASEKVRNLPQQNEEAVEFEESDDDDDTASVASGVDDIEDNEYGRMI
ncbi:hypothetical protein niasHT_027914 [Heterodera trifolii]|uniref:Uncharacterized protein n=1 Tax=Heterodera trifolii TaxID=157864 RepID=A0ABD2JDT3_9BILA